VLAIVDGYLRRQPDQWIQLVGNHEGQYLPGGTRFWPEELSPIDSRLLRLGFAAPAGYLALIIAGSMATGRQMSPAARLRLPLVLAATHLSWGAGFLMGRKSA